MSDVNELAREPASAVAGATWVTDGGLETDLVFHHGVHLPHLAAHPLLDTADGRSLLTDYYLGYAAVAARAGARLLLETPTRRANPHWIAILGGHRDDVRRVNIESIVFLAALGESLLATGVLPAGPDDDYGSFRVSGSIGPRGDRTHPDHRGSADELAAYHDQQVTAFAESGAERVTAYTLTTVAEAVGVVRAARAHDLSVSVSFTVETDGRLPDGTPLGEAVAALWEQAAPDGLLVDCAHPSHIARALADDVAWTSRVTGLRVNASRLSHAELDAAEDLDEGDIPELVSEHAQLAARLPRLEVVGGCCGTDVRHVAALWGVVV